MRIVYRSFFIYLAVLTATWLFADKAFDLIMEYLGKRFYWFESNIGNDVLMSVLCICISVVLWLQPRKQSLSVYTSLRRNIVALVLAFIYVFASLQYRERFTAIYTIQWLAYADVLMVWLAIWYFTPLLKVLGTKGIVEETKKQARLKGDEIHPVDELQRNNEAHAICEYILDDTNDYSTTLAVSVTGSWGAGKTVLMNYLKDCLKEKGITFFDYSPWQRSEKDVALDFISSLNHHLYDQNIGLISLDEYIRTLKVSNVTGWFNLTVHALTSLLIGKNKSTSELLVEASEDMGNLERPVVAFIDDVDRISREDFMDVMRLIRATANFPNLVYIVAYDRERALKLLGDDYGEGFLTKIFNVNHPLTNISDDKLHELAYERFKEYGIKEETDSPFALIDLTEYLPTIREMKRFFNLLNKDYMAQAEMIRKTYFNFAFYAKLELLKHTDLLAYIMLKNEPTAYLEVDKENWNDVPCYKTKADLNLQNKASHQLLLQMFDQEIGEFNKFVCPGGLQMMFENDLDDSYVNKQEFEQAVKEDKLEEKVKSWIKQRKQGITFCLSENLHLPTELLAKVQEILVGNMPSDIIHHYSDQHYELYDNSSLDSFSRIADVQNPYDYVEKNHELFLYFRRSLSEGNKTEEEEIVKLLKYAEVTESPRELLAIISGMMKQNWSNDTAPEKWQFDLAEVLFNRLASNEPYDDLKNQYFVVEAMHYLPFFDATGNLLLPQLKRNPAIWLRLTLNVDSDFGPIEKVTVNTNVLHSLFDTYETYKAVMADLKQTFKGDNNTIIILDEHLLLTERTSLIMALSVSQFDAKNYPALMSIKYKEERRGIFVSAYYEDTKEMMEKGGCAFFNNEGKKPELFGEN